MHLRRRRDISKVQGCYEAQEKIKMERKDLNRLFVVILFLVIAYLSFILVRDFLISVVIGAIIAYVLLPPYNRLVKITKSERFSAIILSLVVIAIIALVSALIVPEIIIEGAKFYQSSDQVIQNQFEEFGRCTQDSEDLKCKLVTYILRNVDKETLKNIASSIAQGISNFVVNNVITFFKNIPNLVIQFIIILFSTYYFLHNGKGIVNSAFGILPLEESQKSKIKQRIDDVMKAVIFGNLIIAVMEGVIGTIIFLLLGISMPYLWGLLIMFFALIPPFCAGIIWGPVAIILFIMGEYTKAIILAVVCLAIMGSMDNILKPRIIGKKVRLSSLWILLGVLGGLFTFGFVGIFIGPLILALFVTVIEIVSEEWIEKEK